jgi:predicted ATPase
MKNTEHLEVMKLLDKLITATYSFDKILLVLAILKNFRMTLKHGICEYTPPTIATLGLMFASLKNYELAAKCGEFSLMLLKKLNIKSTYARTLFAVHGFCLCWTKPVATKLVTLLEAFQVGTAVGDNKQGLYVSVSMLQ